MEPRISYEVAQEMAGTERLRVRQQALRRRLRERGFLVNIDVGRHMVQVRRTLEGVPRIVLHLKSSSLEAHMLEHQLSGLSGRRE